MSSTDAALSTASSTQSGAEAWVHPEDLYMWELAPYIAKYGGHWSSYKLHYEAALKGKRVSVERMEFTISAFAAARLRAAGTGTKLDERPAKNHDRGIWWYGR